MKIIKHHILFCQVTDGEKVITCEKLNKIFTLNDIVYFSGVPDSTFKGWMTFLANNEDKLINRIAANEGAAIAHTVGYYLSTGKIGVVYMQNSGLGNCVNPLTSLADNDVFGIPMILMIGWRGEPGRKDEPQHKKMGKITLPLLNTLEIPYEVIEENKIEEQLRNTKVEAEKSSMPIALIIQKGMIEDYRVVLKEEERYPMQREEAIRIIVDTLNEDDVIVSTTGKISRELFGYRKTMNNDLGNDFYTIGSMGHCSAIALEIAKQKPEKRVYIFEGDGSVIMHAGTLATIGNYGSENLIHVVFDNNSYESTGGQPTVSDTIDIARIAKGCGYRDAFICSEKEEIIEKIKNVGRGPVMLNIKVRKGSRKDLLRPTISPLENKNRLMGRMINRNEC